jgi:hypothetical protein
MSIRYRSGIGPRARGFGILAWMLAIPVAIIVLLILAVGFFEGRKAYWDSKVKEMCEKEGGVKVFEKISISLERYNRIPKVGGFISMGPESSLKPEDVVFWVMTENVLRDWNPRVVRREELVKRRTDGKTMGKIISYSRIGGDFPNGISHHSSFACPEPNQLYAAQEYFFLVEGETK